MSKEKRRVPKLRFPGFTEDWEQRKADYIFKSITDKGYPELPVLSASQELGMVYRDQNGIDIQHDKKNETSYKRVLPGQFVIHLRSFQGGFAYSEVEGITSPAYTVMSFKNSSEQYGLFWKHVFKSERFIKRLETITYGIRDGRSISFSDFKSLILQYPSFSEQKLIGDSIAVLEKGITLHQRKLDNLKLKKKALLQKLFPKNGERYPELRFPEFTDAWEQRKLSDLMEVTSVKRIHQADWTDSGVRFFRARDIVSSMNNEEIDNPVFISKDKYEEYSRVSGKVIEGDLLVTGVGTIGVPYLIKDTTPLYFKDGNIIWFKNNNTLNGSYFYYCFQNSYIQNQIYSASGKGTVGTYTIENGKKTSIRYPSLKEQIKIGNLLDTMTTMITLHQRKLDHLQLQKKALLQQMFV